MASFAVASLCLSMGACAVDQSAKANVIWTGSVSLAFAGLVVADYEDTCGNKDALTGVPGTCDLQGAIVSGLVGFGAGLLANGFFYLLSERVKSDQKAERIHEEQEQYKEQRCKAGVVEDCPIEVDYIPTTPNPKTMTSDGQGSEPNTKSCSAGTGTAKSLCCGTCPDGSYCNLGDPCIGHQ